MNALRLPDDLRGDLRHDEPMARHTSWRVGGPADVWFRPADLDDLAAFLAALPAGVPVTWVGLGSNLLVRDGGLRGAVVSTHGVFAELDRDDRGRVRAGAGIACAKLARRCARWGLGPANFFAGIPGTLGGALAMNAGAWGGETWDSVVAVETVARDGRRRRRARDEYEVAYRSVTGPGEEWFVTAEFVFAPAPGGSEGIRELLVRRKASQPIGLPSCGSVFRNPPGEHAARLIESAGLKGHRIGGACVSDQHANFIINSGEASASDIERLIAYVAATVLDRHGVSLRTEVRIVGEGA